MSKKSKMTPPRVAAFLGLVFIVSNLTGFLTISTRMSTVTDSGYPYSWTGPALVSFVISLVVVLAALLIMYLVKDWD